MRKRDKAAEIGFLDYYQFFLIQHAGYEEIQIWVVVINGFAKCYKWLEHMAGSKKHKKTIGK